MRRARPSDLPSVNRLLAEFDREATTWDLSDPDLIVVIDDEGLALAAVYVSRDLGRYTAHCTSLVVAPAARGRGLAKQAMRAIADEAQAFADRYKQRMRVFGYSNPSRAASIHILEQLGWQHLGEAIGDRGSHLWAIDLEPRVVA